MTTIYTKQNCNQCDLSKMLLSREGVPFNPISLEEDETVIEKVKELGYLQLPVVVTPDGEHWSGFRPDKIKELSSKVKESL